MRHWHWEWPLTNPMSYNIQCKIITDKSIIIYCFIRINCYSINAGQLSSVGVLEILFNCFLFCKNLVGLTFSPYCTWTMRSSHKSAADREKLYLKNPKRRQEKYSAASAMQKYYQPCRNNNKTLNIDKLHSASVEDLLPMLNR